MDICIYICIRIYKLEYISFCRRRVDRDQQYWCLTVTHQPQVLLGVDQAFLFALFSGGPHWGSIPALVEILRLWAQAVCSAEIFSKLRGIKINLYPPPAMTMFTYCFAFRFLLSVSKCPKVSNAHLKLIWNSLLCLLMLHGEDTKKFTGEPQVMKSPEACNTTYNILIY